MAGLNDLLPSDIRYPQEMKCPVCLLLDVSSSMSGEPVRLLNQGVSELKKELLNDNQAKKTVEICVVTFGGSVKPYPFCTPENFNPPTYTAGGGTPMGEAILQGLDLIEKRKEQYKAQGIHKYRPWVVIMTDGAPTDMSEGDTTWAQVVNKLEEYEENKKIIAWTFGVPGADFDALNKLLSHQELDKRRVYELEGYDFKALFKWLSDSIAVVSRSKEGEKIKIDAPPAKQIELEV